MVQARAKSSSRGRKANGRKQEILRIAAELFIRHGYQATTVRAIADAAGILSGSLYHHYASKEDFADEIIRVYIYYALDRYKQVIATQRSPRDKLEFLVRAAITPVIEHRAALLVLQHEGRELSRKRRFAYIDQVSVEIEAIWSEVIRAGIADGCFHPNIDPALPYYTVRDSVVSAARWFDPAGRLSLEDLVEQYVTIFLHGVCQAE